MSFDYIKLGYKLTPRFHLSLAKSPKTNYYKQIHIENAEYIEECLWSKNVNRNEVKYFDLYIFLSGMETIKAISELYENFPNIQSGKLTKYIAITMDEYYEYEKYGYALLKDFCNKNNIQIEYDDPG